MGRQGPTNDDWISCLRNLCASNIVLVEKAEKVKMITGDFPGLWCFVGTEWVSAGHLLIPGLLGEAVGEKAVASQASIKRPNICTWNQPLPSHFSSPYTSVLHPPDLSFLTLPHLAGFHTALYYIFHLILTVLWVHLCEDIERRVCHNYVYSPDYIHLGKILK